MDDNRKREFIHLQLKPSEWYIRYNMLTSTKEVRSGRECTPCLVNYTRFVSNHKGIDRNIDHKSKYKAELEELDVMFGTRTTDEEKAVK